MTIDPELLELVARSREGVLATIKRDGRPQLSNILYVWDTDARIARISTTADRAKARNLERDPRAALYVPGDHFWAYVVAEGDVELSGVSREPGDAAGRELLAVQGAFYGDLEEETFFAQMIDARRLVIRLHVTHTYGMVIAQPPGS